MRTIASLKPAPRAALMLFAALLLVAAWACNDSEAHEPVYGADIAATSYVVFPGVDTVLKTPGGALISITAGSLDAGDANSVTLDVKEAYTSADMTRAGLASTSLTSNGMIYINVAAGQSVSIHKALTIALPAKEGGNDWMLYKASAGEDGLLKWGDERPLIGGPSSSRSSGAAGSGAAGGSNEAGASVDAGKTIFQSRCASCHGGKEEGVGPALAWITQRRDRQWLYAFTRNNATLLWRGDAYSCYLYNRYKTPMPLFKDLTDEDMASLYRFIDKASRPIDSNSVFDYKRGFDSCVSNDPNCGGVASRRKAVDDVGTAIAPADTTTITPSPIPATKYYTFAVDKHGWYSVARKAGAAPAVVVNIEFPAMADAGQHAAPEMIKACPCWCDVTAYKRADSLGRAK